MPIANQRQRDDKIVEICVSRRLNYARLDRRGLVAVVVVDVAVEAIQNILANCRIEKSRRLADEGD